MKTNIDKDKVIRNTSKPLADSNSQGRVARVFAFLGSFILVSIISTLVFTLIYLIIFPIKEEPSPNFRLSPTSIDSIAAKTYGDIVAAVGNGNIEVNTQTIVKIHNYGSQLIVENPTKQDYILSLPKLAKSTKITGSTSTDGKRWCFQITDSKTLRGYYGIVYTEKGLAFQSYWDRLPSSQVCYKGITADIPWSQRIAIIED